MTPEPPQLFHTRKSSGGHASWPEDFLYSVRMDAESTSEAARLLARQRWGDPAERRRIRRSELLAELQHLDAQDNEQEAVSADG